MGTENRQRTQHIMVRVTPAERAAIKDTAGDCGLTAASLMRSLALGHQVRGVVDQKAVLELLRVNADLGRLGGLLKHWLADEDKRPALETQRDIVDLLKQLTDTRQQLKAKVLSL